MADWMFGFLVILFFGSCLTDLGESRATPTVKVLPRPGKPTVTKVDGLAVTLTWSKPANATATQKYEVRYQADGQEAVTHKTVSKNWATLNLGPNRWYTIWVKAPDPNGKGPLSDALRIHSNESRPGKAPPNVVVKPQLPTLHVSWGAIPDDHHNGILLGYVILIKIYGTADWREHHTNRTSVQIKGLDTTKTYTIRVAGLTKEGTGTQSVAIHFDSNGPLTKTTARPFKTSAPSSVASTQGTTPADTTMKVAPQTDKHMNVTVNSKGTRKTTSVRSRVPSSEWISTAEATVIKEIYKTTQRIETERMVDYSQAKPKETAFLMKFILFGAPALGFILLFSCFVGFVLWRRKKSQQKELNSDVHSTQSEKGSKKRKPVVTRGENTVTYCLPPQYTEKDSPVPKSDAMLHSQEVKPFTSGTNLGDVYDQEKQRIYESMDGLQSALNGEVDEHRYVEPDQLCVVLPSKHPEPGDVHGHQPEPRKEPQYANVGQSCHLYEALHFQEQGPFYANAKAALNRENQYENEKCE